MYKLDDSDKARKLISILGTVIDKFEYVGKRKWGNPSGDQQELDVYEITNGVDKVWLSTVEWCNASTGEINRCGIITTVPDYNLKNTLGQIFEMNIPFYFSKSFNTRVYEEGNTVEVRNYGKFTIGRRGLKREYFFNYLRENGFENEIEYDEDGKEYISVIKFENGNIDAQHLNERLIKCTNLLKEFKDYYRSLLLQ